MLLLILKVIVLLFCRLLGVGEQKWAKPKTLDRDKRLFIIMGRTKILIALILLMRLALI